jgi:hypothetical protein
MIDDSTNLHVRALGFMKSSLQELDVYHLYFLEDVFSYLLFVLYMQDNEVYLVLSI